MRAGVFRGVRQVPIEDVPDPSPGPRDIVLEVKACGICGSDLLAEEGQVMGHEFSGEVVEVGPEVEGIAVGDRVTGLPIQPCGDCRQCLEGRAHLCETWTRRSVGYGIEVSRQDHVCVAPADELLHDPRGGHGLQLALQLEAHLV